MKSALDYMEKDIDRIPKNQETDIVIRIDDFGGRPGLTIREFVKSDRYTGFTKAGTRIPADQFKNFKAAINSIKEDDFEQQETAEQGESEQEEQDEIGNNSNSDSNSGAPEELEM